MLKETLPTDDHCLDESLEWTEMPWTNNSKLSSKLLPGNQESVRVFDEENSYDMPLNLKTHFRSGLSEKPTIKRHVS
jgi:hypothetical protein